MLISMTGYGEGSATANGVNICVKVRTVNGRYMDISVRTPELLNQFEKIITDKVREKFSRGSINVYVNIMSDTKTDLYEIKVDVPLAETYIEAVSEIENLSSTTSISDILGLPEVVKSQPREDVEEMLKEILVEALEEALDKALQMRIKEGKSLNRDLLERVVLIRGYVENIIENRAGSSKRHAIDLHQKLMDILGSDFKIDEERIIQEAALLATKSDPTEEIVRLQSHLEQFEQALQLEKPVGSKLKFIQQEANREANTIGAKSDDIEVGKIVISIKEELERIREQIQNVE